MSVTISVYSRFAFKEFLLPATDNTNESLILKRDVFQLPETMEILLEVIDGKWRFTKSGKYEIVYTASKANYDGAALSDGNLFSIYLPEGGSVSVLVKETNCSFNVYKKIDLRGLDGKELTIGRNEDNLISYGAMKLVSGIHAVIRKGEGSYVLEDRSSNGTFVNARRIKGAAQLSYGDSINIFGLNMLFLGGILAVNMYAPGVKFREEALLEYRENEAEQTDVSDWPAVNGTVLFHRAPRHIARLETRGIEIESPPQPKETVRQPLYSIIGPSLTMAIPMMLGSGLSILSTRMNGSGGSAFMYTGLITAVSSAFIGSVWTLINLRNTKKKNREEELHRFEAYGEYLIRCTNEIKEKYQKNRAALLQMYPDAAACAQYNARTSSLWNRNLFHEDFLTVRLGLGSIPFQAPIQIPKEKFTMIHDSLAGKPAMIQKEYQMLHDVPVCIDLLRQNIVGVIGGEEKRGAYRILRALTAQLAANNCYTDVKLIYLYDEAKADSSWRFAKWFPHVWSEDKKARYVAAGKEQASEVLYELTKVLRQRSENAEQPGNKDTVMKPHYVLFVDEMSFLEGELISRYIFDKSGRLGLTTFLLAERYEELPNICELLLEDTGQFQGMYRVMDDMEQRQAISFDEVSEESLEKLAVTLAGVEVSEVEVGGEIPGGLSFFEMYGVRRLSELNVQERWLKNRTYESMKAVIGQKAGGTDCYLDVHEKYHGPHGLVAGTTGSGKSETLQTYILSLAVNYSPDDVGFFLIDYKGGGMANLFEGLPHVMGQISNLSGNQVKRAMVAIKSENKRRQRIFNEHGVNNINLYTRLYKNKEAKLPVPHMFIIIDEFAELKREEPDFMRELISVAQVGRSLGVHLILATQKPSGTVDDNIWSNSKFRLCLRVQDRQDSNDMLHKPDAAYLTQAGRCYLQVGNDELYELFQSGFSGAAYDEDGGTGTEIARMISNSGKAALIGSYAKYKKREQEKLKWLSRIGDILESVLEQQTDLMEAAYDSARMSRLTGSFYEQARQSKLDYPVSEYNTRRLEEFIGLYAECKKQGAQPMAEAVAELAEKQGKRLPEQKEKTQLDAVVEYLHRLALQLGYGQTGRLWLPVLPTELYLEELPGFERNLFNGRSWEPAGKQWSLEIMAGLYDDPENQAQKPVLFDLVKGGNHAVCGTITCGKSTFLQTFVYALLMRYSPRVLNLYGIDFSSRMLSAFENAPHVGGILYENEEEKADKFFTMLESILKERKSKLKGGNFSQYIQANGNELPAVVVVIDNYAGFRLKTNYLYDDIMLRISQEGVGYGIYLLVSSAGFGGTEIPTKMGENFRTVVCLEMNDKFQYAEALRTMRVEVLPEVNVKGRGLAFVGENILEFQTALSLKAEDDFKRIDELDAVSRKMSDSFVGRRARKIPEIPKEPVWAEFAALEETEKLWRDDRHLPLGYDLKNAMPYGVDLSKMYCYIISGAGRTGKTNTLKALINSAVQKEGSCYVIDFDGNLKSFAAKAGAEYIGDDERLYRFAQELIGPFKERNARKHLLTDEGCSDEEMYERMSGFERIYIFVENLKDFAVHTRKPEKNAAATERLFTNLLEKGFYHNVFWFACLNQEDHGELTNYSVYEAFVKYKYGLHLGGCFNQQRIFPFEYIPFAQQGKSQKPGIAAFPGNREEETEGIAIPLVKG